MGERIGVHFRFKTGTLSLRSLHPRTGSLQADLGTCKRQFLKAAEFRMDTAKRAKWLAGNVHARQFAEVTGIPIATRPRGCIKKPVILLPKKSPHFLMDDKPVTNADYVEIIGDGKNRQIFAYFRA
ncbi:MAG: hypothetical protein GC136_09435 [Alphaproteobacteria bacterium]|nr:hypothetical protein [Alphaproteobacteria bacterium]